MADKYGYKKGARGIDGNHGEDFKDKHVDRGAHRAMYGAAANLGGASADITGESGMGSRGGAHKSIEQMAKSAVKGERKLGKAKR